MINAIRLFSLFIDFSMRIITSNEVNYLDFLHKVIRNVPCEKNCSVPLAAFSPSNDRVVKTGQDGGGAELLTIHYDQQLRHTCSLCEKRESIPEYCSSWKNIMGSCGFYDGLFWIRLIIRINESVNAGMIKCT